MSREEQLEALAVRIGQEIKAVRSQIAVNTIPIFETLAEAQAYESANPGKKALWFDPSYAPGTVYEDGFASASASIYGNLVNGTPWFQANGTPFGIATGSLEMLATNGYATHGAGAGSGAGLEVNHTEMDIEVDYDLTAGSTSNRQVRVFGRGDPFYTTSDRSTMPVMAIMRETGALLFEPYESSPGTFTQKTIVASGLPLTGNLRLVLSGGEARIFVDGVQQGATEVLDPKQQVGTVAGFNVRNTGQVHHFKASVPAS